MMGNSEGDVVRVDGLFNERSQHIYLLYRTALLSFISCIVITIVDTMNWTISAMAVLLSISFALSAWFSERAFEQHFCRTFGYQDDGKMVHGLESYGKVGDSANASQEPDSRWMRQGWMLKSTSKAGPLQLSRRTQQLDGSSAGDWGSISAMLANGVPSPTLIRDKRFFVLNRFGLGWYKSSDITHHRPCEFVSLRQYCAVRVEGKPDSPMSIALLPNPRSGASNGSDKSARCNLASPKSWYFRAATDQETLSWLQALQDWRDDQDPSSGED